MSNPTKTRQAAAIAAKEDAMPTGPAGLPGTEPASLKPRLSPEAKAARTAKVAADQERNLNYRASQVCSLLVEMGSASLAGRIGAYDTVDVAIAEAALVEVEKRVAVCRAALATRKAAGVRKTTPEGKPQKFALNLRAAVGTPATVG